MTFFLFFLACTAFSVAAPKEPELLPGSYYFTFSEQVNTLDTSLTLFPTDRHEALVLSNGTIIWMEENTAIKIDQRGLEHVPNTNDYYFTIDLLQGDLYFKLISAPNETSTMMVQTPSAQLEIHSSEFSIEHDFLGEKELSIVRCYSGYIILTNTKTFEATIVNEQQRASIMGSDEEKNTSIIIGNIDQRTTDRWQRTKDSVKIPSITWRVVDGHYVRRS